MYKETPHAKQGDLGSNLPVDEAAVEWTVGQEVNVAWTIQVTLRLIFMKVSKKNCHFFFRQTMEVGISTVCVLRVSLLPRYSPPLR